MYTEQSRTRDVTKRLALIHQFEKRVLDEKVYAIYVLWWQRIIPHWTTVRGYKMTSNHYVDPDLEIVWLSE
jgi:hypothetical protein